MDYKIDSPSNFTKEEKEVFLELLIKQDKVVNPSAQRIDACKWLGIHFCDNKIVSIAALKPPSRSDFDNKHACLNELRDLYKLELGYCYTLPKYGGRRFSSKLVSSLLEKENKTLLLASTETRLDNYMLKILKKFEFKQQGKTWRSTIHGGELALFLKI